MQTLGQTRSANQRDHLLQTPDTFVRIALPGLTNGVATVHIGPAAGAGFAQYSVELAEGGALAPGIHQRFLYMLQGSATLRSDSSSHMLETSGYAYLPSGSPHTLSANTSCRLAVIEKRYQPLGSEPPPELIIGEETALPSAPLLGDTSLQVRQLLPDHAAFDFAVNTMTYEPGASLSMVEVHVMEHGLLMLQGKGIYRLGDRWYPVAEGDFIWMAPFCPQWFGALGKAPAKYLIYKDVNRSPVG